MFAERPTIQRLTGDRLHLQHGPIDIVLRAWGEPADLARAYEAAAERFGTVLGELVGELAELRKPMADGPQVSGPVARRMVAGCLPFAGVFLTPMAAVAGSVADELMAAMTAAAPLAKAFVNNGGDIAVHLSPGTSLEIGIAGDLGAGAIPSMNGRIALRAGLGIGGIATSGRGGRSFSLGIADSVTVLAANAATADAAATLIANAVDIDSPAVARAPASALDPDSDLGERLVTVDVGPLTTAEGQAALENGRRRAEDYRRAGLIAAAALTLQGETLIVGEGLAARRLAREGTGS
jgi:ApbE superfamily uncharacterized protein (UPF0280 family)